MEGDLNIFKEIDYNAAIDLAAARYYKIVLVVGRSGSGKTNLLKKICSQIQIPLINLGIDLSQKLLPLTSIERKLKTCEIISKLIDALSAHRLPIDNTEVIFDPSLMVNPLGLHKFCFSCGIRLEINNFGLNGRVTVEKIKSTNTEKKSEKDISIIDKLKTLDLKDIFKKMETAIKKECSLSGEEFEKNWGKFKKYHYKNYSDNDIYWILVQVAFYSGMKAATVTEKLPAIKKYFQDFAISKNFSEIEVNTILKDQNTIHHKRKIEACINNAIIFDKIINRHGSFSNYIESFGNLQEDRTLDVLKNDLMQFDYIGPITAYHVMLDLGLNVWKPDRVIRRILFRLGLISAKENIEESIMVGKKFSHRINEPIRYIDIIMVKYGQMGEEEGFGLAKGGICLEKNPRCPVCGINEYCNYLNPGRS